MKFKALLLGLPLALGLSAVISACEAPETEIETPQGETEIEQPATSPEVSPAVPASPTAP